MHKITLYFLFAVSCCAHSVATAAITSPYTNNFVDETSILNHTETTNGQWSVLAPGRYQNEIVADLIPNNESSSSMLEFTDLGGAPLTATDFSLSTVFTITNTTGDFNSLGFAILGSSLNATTNASSHYLADLYIGGGMMNAYLRFDEIGTAPTLSTGMWDLEKVLLQNTPYQLRLEGKYADNGDLTLKLELTGDNDYDSFTLPAIPANNVLQGQHFGFRDRTGTTGSALTVEYSSLNVAAIPEPSSIGFVAMSLIGGYAVGRYWRRRQAKNNA